MANDWRYDYITISDDMSKCPEELVCFTEDEWVDFLLEYEIDIVNEVGTFPVAPPSDAHCGLLAWLRRLGNRSRWRDGV